MRGLHKHWLPLLLAGVLFSVSCAHRRITAPVAAPGSPVAKADVDADRDEDVGQDSARDWFLHQRAYPFDRIPVGARQKAFQQLERLRVGRRESQSSFAQVSLTNPFQWNSIGPMPISEGTLSTVIGLVDSIAVDPRNSNIVYAAANVGGIWKTTDGGQSWIPLGDFQPTLHTGVVRLDPSNPDVVYAGTGLNYCGEGAGILKSSDQGASWTLLSGALLGALQGQQMSSTIFFSIAIHPTQSNVVLAGVGGCGVVPDGVYRSTDGGNTWSIVLSGGVGGSILFDPTGTNVYAGIDGVGVYQSVDAGVTWAPVLVSGSAISLENAGLIELAIAPTSPNILFASIANNNDGTLLGMYKTTDSGKTWVHLANTPNFCNTQCWAYPSLAVHPANPNIIFAGGLDLYRSMDGGATWLDISQGSNGIRLHVDHHGLAFSSDLSTLYVSSDGGVWSGVNFTAPNTTSGTFGGTWTSLNNSLAITEFYNGFSINPNNLNVTFAGTQDNGSLQYSGSGGWAGTGVCGDGGQTAIDPATPSTVYLACIGISGIGRSTTNGTVGSFQLAFSGVNLTDRHGWLTPFILDPANPTRLYFGTYHVYQTTNQGQTWVPISPDLTNGQSWDSLTALAVSADSNTVYAGSDSGLFSVTNNANAGQGATWTNRSVGLPGRYITHITPDPTDPLTAYVTVSGFGSGHVFQTKDQGISWIDISGNLPDIPANDILVDPDLPGTLYVATDLGVFMTFNGGGGNLLWTPLGDGLPYTIATGLQLHRATRTLRVGTFGRGMWDLSVPTTAPRLSNVSVAPAAPGPGFALTMNGVNFVPASVAQMNGVSLPTAFISNTQLTATVPPGSSLNANGNLVAVSTPGNAGGLSNAVSVAIGPTISAGGIQNAAASASPAVLTPGTLAAIYGTQLAAQTAQAAAPFPVILGGVSVTVNGVPAPLYYVSPTQIDFVVPWEVKGPQAAIAVQVGGFTSMGVTVAIAPSAPQIFTVNSTGQAAALIAGTTSLAAPVGAFPGSQPVQHGQYVILYATGLGAVQNQPADGSAPSGLSPTVQTPYVGFGCLGTNGAVLTCIDGPVQFAGLAPGFVGLYQVNAQVPSVAMTGDAVPVVIFSSITTDVVQSNKVTIAIQ